MLLTIFHQLIAIIQVNHNFMSNKNIFINKNTTFMVKNFKLYTNII